MTLVDLSVLYTVLGGLAPVTRGTATVLYVVGTKPFTDLVGDEVRFSTPMVLPITGDPLVADLAPTRGRCAAKVVIEDHVSGRTLIRHVEIPDVPHIDFGELDDVNPDTFEPSEEGQAAWDAAVAAANTALQGAVAAQGAAVESAGAADESARAALEASELAVPAASSAVTAATDAALARDDAQRAAGDAVAAAESLSETVGDVTDLKTLTTSGRLGEAQLSSTFARVPSGRDMLPDGSRRSTLVLGTPNGAGAVNANYTQRVIAKIPVTATRWRMLVGNRSASAAYTSPGSVTGLWIGDPAYATADPFRWNGNFQAAPTKVWDGGTVPVDGTDLVSPWITGGLDAGEEILLSMGVITTNTGTGTAYGQSRQIWRVTSAGGSAQAGDQNLVGSAIADNGLFYDVRIEYEFEGSEPIGLFIGDSITDGYSDGDITATQQGTHSHEAWPGVAGMQGRFNFINLGSAGATAGSFGNPAAYAWTRVDLATTVPDFAVVALGINDVNATTALASWQAQMKNIVDNLKSIGVKRIIIATLAPREYAATQTCTLTAAASIGATTLTVDRLITGTILVGQGPTQEQLVVSSGAGNTLTLSAATTKAHAVGDSIANTKERLRRDYNTFIRNLPWGVSGVLDYDAILSASPGSASPDPRMMSADLLHPLRAGYALIGSAAKGLVG